MTGPSLPKGWTRAIAPVAYRVPSVPLVLAPAARNQCSQRSPGASCLRCAYCAGCIMCGPCRCRVHVGRS